MSLSNRHTQRLFLILAAACVLVSPAGAGGGEARFRLESPYDFGAHPHKVQLHAHTTNSDGDHSGEWVMQAYQNLRYAAVAITDHDHARYMASLADPKGHTILHIPGIEYSGDDKGTSWNHMLGIHIRTVHHADGTGARQAQIEQAKKEEGLTYLCHPYDESIHPRGWNGQDVTEMVHGFTGIEIHNGGSYHEPGGRDYPYKVDLALTFGKRIHVIAVDDFHRNPQETMDRGYVVINSNRTAEALRLEDIISALSAGNYFAAGRVSTSHPVPPHFTDISVKGRTVRVQTDRPSDIEFITYRYNYHKEGPKYAQKNEGVTSAQFTASLEDRFVRITAAYTENGKTSYAWSNPIYCEAE